MPQKPPRGITNEEDNTQVMPFKKMVINQLVTAYEKRSDFLMARAKALKGQVEALIAMPDKIDASSYMKSEKTSKADEEMDAMDYSRLPFNTR